MLRTLRIFSTLSVILLWAAASGCATLATPIPAVLTPGDIAKSTNPVAPSDSAGTAVPTATHIPSPTLTTAPTGTPTLTGTPLPSSTPSLTAAPLPTSTPTAFDFAQAGQIMIDDGYKLRTTSAQSPWVCPVYQFCRTYMNPYETLIITVLDDKSMLFLEKHYASGSTAFHPLFTDLFGDQAADTIFEAMPGFGSQVFFSVNGYAVMIEWPTTDMAILVAPGMTVEMIQATEASFGPKK